MPTENLQSQHHAGSDFVSDAWEVLPGFPGRSSFGASNRYLCTELAHSVKKLCPEFVPNTLADELISPYSLYLNMKQSWQLEHVPWITTAARRHD